MILVAIDPGLSGGLAIHRGVDIQVYRMPVCDAPGGRKGRRIDVERLRALLAPLVHQGALAVIESQQAMPRQGVASTFKTGMGYGLLLGVLGGLGLEVLEVNPRKWKQILPKEKRGEKQHTIELVGRVFPDVSLIPRGCRVPHDGIADALGILLWALREHRR